MNHFLFLIPFMLPLAAFSQNSEAGGKMRLDSIVEVRQNILSDGDTLTIRNKTAYLYDKNENEILRTRYDWDTQTNDWVETRKYEYKYDSNKNIISMIVQNFNDYLIWNAFVYPLTKNEYTYDINGNQTLDVKFRWNYTTNDWEEFYKHKSIYDSNNNIVMYIEDDFKREYVYDENGKMIKEIYYMNIGKNVWRKEFKTEYIYNDNGNMKRDIYYCNRGKKLSWNKEYKTEYLYDDKNLIMELRIPFYEGRIVKFEYTYDSNKNQIKNEYYEFGRNNTLIFGRKYEYLYDSNQNRIKEISYNGENNIWKASEKTEYIYDTLYFQENIIYPHRIYNRDVWNKIKAYNMLIEEKCFNKYGRIGEYTNIKFYYSPQN